MAKKASAEIPVKVNSRAAKAGLRSLEGQFKSSAGKMTVSALGLGKAMRTGAKYIALAGTAASAAASAMVLLSLRAAQNLDPLQKLSIRLGIATAELSRLKFAAEQSGADFTLLQTGLTALGRRASAMPQLFSRWGISIKDANGSLMPLRDVMAQVADRIKNASGSAERLAIAQDLMSEAGRKMVPFLMQGNEAIKALGDQADALGISITNFEAEAGAVFGDRMNIWTQQTNTLAAAFGASLVPVVEALGRAYDNLGGPMVGLIRNNRTLIQQRIADVFNEIAIVAIPMLGVAIEFLADLWEGLTNSIRLAIGTTAVALKTFIDVSNSITGTSFETRGLTETIKGMSEGMAQAAGRTNSLKRALREMAQVGAVVLKKTAQNTQEVVRQIEAAARASGARTAQGGGAQITDLGPRRVQGRIIEGQAGVRDPGAKLTLGEIDDSLLDDFQELTKSLRDEWSSFSSDFADMSSIFVDSTKTIMSGLASAIQGGIEAAITGAANGLQVMRNILGDMLITLGRMVFEQGAAAFALGLLGLIPGFQANTPGLVLGPIVMAAGAGLMAVGSAIKGGSTDGGSSAPAAATSASPGLSAAAPSGADRTLGVGGAQTVIINVDFRANAVTNPRRTARELTDALSSVPAVGG